MLWCFISAGGVFLLVSAMTKKSQEMCSGYEVNINGVNNHFFVNIPDVVNIIEKVAGKGIKGKKIETFPLSAIEKKLMAEPWISDAELYFDRNNKLIVDVLEKNPVARVFRLNGTSFYIDHELHMLPKSGDKSARLPVFTGFESIGNVLPKSDSLLLGDICSLSLAIQKDSFITAMIDQVDILPNRTFVFVPKLGNQTIIFGDVKDMDEKLNKLKLFYNKVIPIRGWNAFHKINLSFKNQIVASINGREEIVADSLKTIQMLKVMADYAQRMSADTTQTMTLDNEKNTTDASLIFTSFSRDDMPGDELATSTNVNVVPSSTANTTNTKPQTTNAKQQTTNTKQQTPNHKQQTLSNKQQTPNHKQQTLSNKQQTPNHKQQPQKHKTNIKTY